MQREVRKTVTVVFSDVEGSTTLAEQLDPESLRRAMTRYFEVARQVHERHGGVVEKFIGDAVMAVFGIPKAHEDDALRAVRAAEDLRQALSVLNQELEQELEVELAVRTGVNTGLVLAGDGRDGQAFVGGDTVNVAARLERAAAPGEVLIGSSTYRLASDAIRAEPLPRFRVRGKSEPIHAYRLLEITSPPGTPSGRPDPPFVGRTRELAALQAALHRMITQETCQLVTVVGDPGIGKSRLLREFAGQARARAVVLHGRCPPYGAAPTARVVGQLLAQAAAVAPGHVPDSLTDPTALSTDPRGVFVGLRLLLEALAAERPVIVIVDDLHWAEPDLLDLLDYIHAFARGVRLLLLAAARRQLVDGLPCRSGGPGGPTIALRPLPAAQAAELAVRLARPDGLDAGTARQIAAWAEGNPLFVEEQVRHLANDGAPHRSGDDDLPVPPAVEALVVAELDSLPADERSVLELASVVGRSFDWPAVAALAPDRLRSRVGALLLALARRGVIRVAEKGHGQDDFVFRHRLLRDAAYQAIPKHERAILHARAAERLTGPAGDAAAEVEEAAGLHLSQAYRYLAQLAGDEPAPRTPAIGLRRRSGTVLSAHPTGEEGIDGRQVRRAPPRAGGGHR
jgi:class 3 adenylate cyclase